MKKTEYTCDRCGKGISIYGTGYLVDSSLVIVGISMPGIENYPMLNYHLHYICYEELKDWMKEKTK